VIDRLDHLVLTVAGLARTADFYVRSLGMREEAFGAGRRALVFGRQKFNRHEAVGAPILPRVGVEGHLHRKAFAVELGPVSRTGAAGPIRSLYLRDPDGNFVEVSEYV
jgi:catechol 2,3-dioxygenase-like lactoylglutathione lyase family enzyme